MNVGVIQKALWLLLGLGFSVLIARGSSSWGASPDDHFKLTCGAQVEAIHQKNQIRVAQELSPFRISSQGPKQEFDSDIYKEIRLFVLELHQACERSHAGGLGSWLEKKVFDAPGSSSNEGEWLAFGQDGFQDYSHRGLSTKHWIPRWLFRFSWERTGPDAGVRVTIPEMMLLQGSVESSHGNGTIASRRFIVLHLDLDKMPTERLKRFFSKSGESKIQETASRATAPDASVARGVLSVGSGSSHRRGGFQFARAPMEQILGNSRKDFSVIAAGVTPSGLHGYVVVRQPQEVERNSSNSYEMRTIVATYELFSGEVISARMIDDVGVLIPRSNNYFRGDDFVVATGMISTDFALNFMSSSGVLYRCIIKSDSIDVEKIPIHLPDTQRALLSWSVDIEGQFGVVVSANSLRPKLTLFDIEKLKSNVKKASLSSLELPYSNVDNISYVLRSMQLEFSVNGRYVFIKFGHNETIPDMPDWSREWSVVWFDRDDPKKSRVLNLVDQQTGQLPEITYGAFSPDSRYLLTSGLDPSGGLGQMTIWAMSDQGLRVIRRIPLGGPVGQVGFSPQQDQIFFWTQSAASAQGIGVYDQLNLEPFRTGTETLDSPSGIDKYFSFRHQSPLERSIFSGDGSFIYTQTNDGTVQVWDTHRGVTLGRGFQDESSSSNVQLFETQRDQQLVSIHNELPGKQIYLWSSVVDQSGEMAPKVIMVDPNEQSEQPIDEVVVSSDGQRILTVQGKQNLGRRRARHQRESTFSEIPRIRIFNVATGLDETNLWASEEDFNFEEGVIDLSETPRGSQYLGLPARSHLDRAVFSPDGQFLAVMTSNPKYEASVDITIFSRRSDRQVTSTRLTIPTLEKQKYFSFLPYGDDIENNPRPNRFALLVGSSSQISIYRGGIRRPNPEGSPMIWTEPAQNPTGTFSELRNSDRVSTPFAASSERRAFAIGYDAGRVVAFHLRSKEERQDLTHRSFSGRVMTFVSYANSGKILLTGAANGALVLWELHFSEDGSDRWVAAGEFKNPHNPSNGLPDAYVRFASLTADHKYLLIGYSRTRGTSPSALIWNVTSQKIVATVSHNEIELGNGSFLPSSIGEPLRFVTTSSDHRRADLWQWNRPEDEAALIGEPTLAHWEGPLGSVQGELDLGGGAGLPVLPWVSLRGRPGQGAGHHFVTHGLVGRP